ncbi:MAG: VOC family protein [Deltaproteobacteria bacterium]|nr:VOC family protein [Deltaproteobacteria bacterium]
MTNPSPQTLGAHHIGLTVPNLHRTREFFEHVLGFTVVGQRPDYPAAFISDGTIMLTLWQAQDPETAVAFDRKRGIGLHHFALRVADAAALGQLHQRLAAEPDVEIEFPPEPLGKGPTQHLMCTIPGGIRMELIATT